jgi:hypothetical protein
MFFNVISNLARPVHCGWQLHCPAREGSRLYEQRSNVVKDYKKDYKEEGLALAGMLVVLLGVMFAAAATVA